MRIAFTVIIAIMLAISVVSWVSMNIWFREKLESKPLGVCLERGVLNIFTGSEIRAQIK